MAVLEYYTDGKWYETPYGEYIIPTKLSQLENDAGFVKAEDLPSGDDEWEFIGEFNVGDEDVTEWWITEDAEGNPIELRKMYFEGVFKASTSTVKTTNIYFGNPAVKNSLDANCRFFEADFLRTSGYDMTKHGIYAYYMSGPSGFNTVGVRATNTFKIGRTGSYGGTIYKDCIGGLAMRTADITTGMIGANSTVKIWGVRI